MGAVNAATTDARTRSWRLAADERWFRLVDERDDEILAVLWAAVVDVEPTYLPIEHGEHGAILRLVRGASVMMLWQAYGAVYDALRRRAAAEPVDGRGWRAACSLATLHIVDQHGEEIARVTRGAGGGVGSHFPPHGRECAQIGWPGVYFETAIERSTGDAFDQCDVFAALRRGANCRRQA